MNVLLAEDNPVNQEVAVGLLETLDCTITVVENGRQAVDAAADGTFDLVLMDCQMPVLDGLNATRAIREAAEGDSRLPIVALTANEGDDVRSVCLAAGMDDLLSKPFTRQELQTLLGRWRPAAEAVQDATQETAPAAAPEAPASTLDLKPIEALRSIDPTGERQLVRRAITKFVDYSDGLLARLAERIAEKDVVEVSRITHSLKSSSANLGALDLARLCSELEKLTGDGTLPDDIGERLKALEAVNQAARRDLLVLADSQ